jgi:hypothetical protein
MALCAEHVRSGKGIIIPLIDDDLVSLLDSLKAGVERQEEDLLQERFRAIALC